MAEVTEAMARAMCIDGGFDPDEMMPNDGPRWRYYVPGVRAAIAAMLEAVGEPVQWVYTSSFGKDVCNTRWARDEGYTSDHWIGWTETPLYSLSPLTQALAAVEKD